MPATADKPKLARLRNVEIFATGRHKGEDYSDADLDDMVRNFNQFSVRRAGREPLVKVPGVIGHEEEQPLLENTGIPKVATPTRLEAKKGIPCKWCDGSGRWSYDGQRYLCPGCRGKGKQSLLLADFDEIPPSIAKLINGRAYDQVSAEVYDEPPEGVPGKGKMLRRVAFLGGDLPHIKSLADLPHADYAEFREDLGAPPSARIRMSRVARLTRGAAGVAVVFSEIRPMLTPHAESAFDKLAGNIERKEGYSKEAADATAAKIGREKYGKEGMEKKAEAGKEAEKHAEDAMGPDDATIDQTPEGPTGAPREELIKQFADEPYKADTDTLNTFDDKQLACVRDMLGNAAQAKAPEDHGVDEYSEDELIKLPEDEGKAKLGERCKMYADRYREMFGESFDPLETRDTKDHDIEPPPSKMAEDDDDEVAAPLDQDTPDVPAAKDKAMAARPAATYSEKAIKKQVDRLVTVAVDAALKKVRADIEPGRRMARKFSEDTKLTLAKAAIRDGIAAGRIGSWEEDSTGGRTLLSKLMALDHTTVKKFSERGKTVSFTEFEYELRDLQRRPVLYRNGELAKAKGTTPEEIKTAEDQKKAQDIAKVKRFAEDHKTELAKTGDTPESFTKIMEKMQPAEREEYMKSLGLAA